MGGLIAVVRYGASVSRRQPSLDGFSASDLSQKAESLVASGSAETAEKYLERAVELENQATYRSQLAVVKYRLGKYQEAIDQYAILIKSGEELAFAYNGQGNAYRDFADHNSSQKEALQKRAISAYNLALLKDEKYVASYSNLAQLLWEMGQKDESLIILDRGITATGKKELSELKNNLLSTTK